MDDNVKSFPVTDAKQRTANMEAASDYEAIVEELYRMMLSGTAVCYAIDTGEGAFATGVFWRDGDLDYFGTLGAIKILEDEFLGLRESE